MVEKIDKYDEEMFLEYVEGQLSHEKRLEFEQHMLGDARLRNLVAQMVLDRHRLRSMPDEQPPAHLMEVVNERLERAMLLGAAPQDFSTNHRPGRGRLGWGKFIAVAAVAAMFTAVAGVFVVTLVQLANDTPIQSSGTASLVPPSSLGPAQLVPGNVTPPYEQQPPATTPDATPSPGDATASSTPSSQGPEQVIPPSPDAGLTPSSPEMAAVEPDALSAFDTTAQAKTLPEADVIWFIRATEVTAAQRRLTAWAAAYDATMLDTRQMMVEVPAALRIESHQQQAATADAPAAALADATQSTSSVPGTSSIPGTPSLPGANEPLSIDGGRDASAPAEENVITSDRTLGLVEQIESIQQREAPHTREALALTMRMDSESVDHLQSFLEALPGAMVHRQQKQPPAAVTQDFFRAWLADDALLPAWLHRPEPQSHGEAASQTSAEDALIPLRQPMIEPAPEAPAPQTPAAATEDAPASQVVRLLLIQA